MYFRGVCLHLPTGEGSLCLSVLIQARNIRLVSEAVGKDEDSASDGPTEIFLDGLSSENPCGARLSLDNQGRLSWPVLFLYPEYAQSDFISAFHEDSRYILHPAAFHSCSCAPPADCLEISISGLLLSRKE